jgi:hypothetical protein
MSKTKTSLTVESETLDDFNLLKSQVEELMAAKYETDAGTKLLAPMLTADQFLRVLMTTYRAERLGQKAKA